MEKKDLIYPFNKVSIDNIKDIDDKVKVSSDTMKFIYNDKEINEEDIMFIGMISYIKLLSFIISNDKTYNEDKINEIIRIIRDDVINRIIDLKEAGELVLLNKLSLEENKLLLFYIKNIILAYEKEYDVSKMPNTTKYQVSKHKDIASLNMAKEKVLEKIK